jgi:hypothetical protein
VPSTPADIAMTRAPVIGHRLLARAQQAAPPLRIVASIGRVAPVQSKTLAILARSTPSLATRSLVIQDGGQHSAEGAEYGLHRIPDDHHSGLADAISSGSSTFCSHARIDAAHQPIVTRMTPGVSRTNSTGVMN